MARGFSLVSHITYITCSKKLPVDGVKLDLAEGDEDESGQGECSNKGTQT